MYSQRKLTLVISAMLALGVANSAMATNGYFTHGVGTESKGMGGSGIGSDGVSGPIMGASNPAVSVFASDSWEIGLSAFSPRRSYSAGPSLAQGQGENRAFCQGVDADQDRQVALPQLLEAGQQLADRLDVVEAHRVPQQGNEIFLPG